MTFCVDFSKTEKESHILRISLQISNEIVSSRICNEWFYTPTALQLVGLILRQLINVTMHFKNKHMEAVPFTECGFAVVTDLPTGMQRFHLANIRGSKNG